MISRNELAVKELQFSNIDLLNWFLQDKSRSINLDPEFENVKIAKQIKNANVIRSQAPSSDYEVINLKKFDELGSCNEYFDSAFEDLTDFLIAEFSTYVKHTILHGSFATNDYVLGWSDVDMFIVVSNNTIDNPSRLLEFRALALRAQELLLKIDPFQHHGFQFITERDLLDYHDSILPREVLDNSVIITGSTKLEINVSSTNSAEDFVRQFKSIKELFKKSYDEGIMKHHGYAGLYLQDDFSAGYKDDKRLIHKSHGGMYQLKYFLSVVVLLPSILLASKGNRCYKRDSFKLVKDKVDPKSWQIIEDATEIRQAWSRHEATNAVGSKKNHIPQWVKERLGPNYFERAFLLAEALEKIDV